MVRALERCKRQGQARAKGHWGPGPGGGGWSWKGADPAVGSGEERVKGSVGWIGSLLHEGGKISMSPPICSGLTLNVNHSITMSLLISTGRRLSPENRGGNLSLKHGKWDGSGAQNPSCLQRCHRGPQAGQPPSSATSSQRGWVLGFCFLTCLVCDLGAFPQAVNYRKRVGMGEMPRIPLEP